MSTPAAPAKLAIALRKSALSLCHAEYIRARLLAVYPGCEIMLRGITTQGDQILDQPLANIGGKGLFIKQIEDAMVEGRADFAVHSLKDIPMEIPEGFVLATIPEREDPRDALVSNKYASIESMPEGAVVGTSSLRREAQLREKNPTLKIKLLRGNVNTRVRKLDEGQYDAMVLACAGLRRLGLEHRISAILSPEEFLPAVGQGALGLECCSGRADIVATLAPLAHPATIHAITAERAFSRRLAGSCHAPIAGFATFRDGGELWLRGLVANREGTDVIRGERAAAVTDPASAEALGIALGDEFLARGAARLTAV
jgi:hydroxymethylbilane synthase